VVVKTQETQAVAATTSLTAQRWPHLLNNYLNTVIDPHLARPETRTTAGETIRALLAPLTTKNCWSLAQQAGHRTPYRIQRLLARASLDESALTSALRGYVIQQLGTDEVVLVLDETGDLKKGHQSVGAARQSPPAAMRPGGTPRYVFGGPATGPLACGPGMTVNPCRRHDLKRGVTGPVRCRQSR